MNEWSVAKTEEVTVYNTAGLVESDCLGILPDEEYVNRPLRKSDFGVIPKKQVKIDVPKDKQLFFLPGYGGKFGDPKGGLYLLMPKNLKWVLDRIERRRYKSELQYMTVKVKRATKQISESCKDALFGLYVFVRESFITILAKGKMRRAAKVGRGVTSGKA